MHCLSFSGKNCQAFSMSRNVECLLLSQEQNSGTMRTRFFASARNEIGRQDGEIFPSTNLPSPGEYSLIRSQAEPSSNLKLSGNCVAKLTKFIERPFHQGIKPTACCPRILKCQKRSHHGMSTLTLWALPLPCLQRRGPSGFQSGGDDRANGFVAVEMVVDAAAGCGATGQCLFAECTQCMQIPVRVTHN